MHLTIINYVLIIFIIISIAILIKARKTKTIKRLDIGVLLFVIGMLSFNVYDNNKIMEDIKIKKVYYELDKKYDKMIKHSVDNNKTDELISIIKSHKKELKENYSKIESNKVIIINKLEKAEYKKIHKLKYNSRDEKYIKDFKEKTKDI